VSSVESSSSSYQSSIQHLNTNLQSLTGTLSTTTDSLASTKADVTALTNSVNGATHTVSSLSQSVTSLTNAVHDLQTNGGSGGGGGVPPGFVSGVQSELQGLAANISLINGMTQSTVYEVGVLLQSMDDTRATLDAQQALVRANVADLTTINSTLITLIHNSIDTTTVNLHTLPNGQITIRRTNQQGSNPLINLPGVFLPDFLTANDGRIFTWIAIGPDVKDVPHCDQGATPGYRFGFPQQQQMNSATGLYVCSVNTGVLGTGPFIDLNIEWTGMGVQLWNSAAVFQTSGMGTIAFTLRFIDGGDGWIMTNMRGTVGTFNFECHSSSF